jgi:hypothetical protein
MAGKEVRRDGHDNVRKPIPFAIQQALIVTPTNKTARHIPSGECRAVSFF